MRKEFNSQRIFWVHQHGRHFIVLEHQYGRRDVMRKRSILRSCLVPRPHYSARPVRSGSPGPSELYVTEMH